jgi:4-hydroxy 2-oxovalerate aldolase
MKTKILDCTIRDGGYLNNWKFSKQLVKDLYRAVSKSGVDYVEIGFRSSEKYFDSWEMGTWRFTPEKVVDEIKSSMSGAEIALMVDYGKVDLDDIPDSSQSSVSLYRVAAHKNKILDAIEFSNAIADKGYDVSIQLMGIVGYTENDFRIIMGPLKNSRLSIVYFADSYGSLIPSDVRKYISILRDTHKPIGFHPHNNLQLSFANTLEAVRCGVDIIDGTVYGMGRGSGNLQLETLISYYEKTVDEGKYNVLPVLELIDKHFLKLAKKFSWGHNLSYMISGTYEVHPNYAGSLIESGKYSIEDIQAVLKLINAMNPVGYDKSIIPLIEKLGFFSGLTSDSDDSEQSETANAGATFQPAEVKYRDRHSDRNFLILANGPSLVMYREKIQKFIDIYNPIIVGSNYLGGLFIPDYHSFNNSKRFMDFVESVHPDSRLLLSSSFPEQFIVENTDRDYEFIQHTDGPAHPFRIEDGAIMSNCTAVSVLSIAAAIVMGAKNIFIAGMDGYRDTETFIKKGVHFNSGTGEEDNLPIDISARSGDYKEQMLWHNEINSLLREINEYLLAKGRSELIIITPTTHKAFYKDMESYLFSAI